MKSNTFIFILLITFTMITQAQKSMEFYSGINISSFKQITNNNQNQKDTTFWNRESLILPNLGFNVSFAVNQKISIVSGMGLHFVGVSHFVPATMDSVLFNDTKFRIGYFKIPIQLNYQIAKKINLITGYGLNYAFRKNQNFFLREGSQSSSGLISNFHNYHHQLQLGVNYFFTPFLSMKFIYNKGLNPIKSTPSNYFLGNSTLKAQILELSFCYTIYNPEHHGKRVARQKKDSKKYK